MIAVSRVAGQSGRWQEDLREAVDGPSELLAALGLDPALHGPALEAASRFPLKVPRPFLARIARGDASDPLLRQVLPVAEELEDAAGYVSDPVGDLASVQAPGLLHKYAGRALLVATGSCAIHCRYCFRREFPYGEQLASSGRFREALRRIAEDCSIEEVILSGGDPLSLSNARLAELGAGIEAIPHVRRIRIHTRHPVVLPRRVDDGLLAWLGGLRLPVVMVIHANHAAEIDGEAEAALAALAGRGVMLLNQSVLLRGVNDSIEALQALSERLAEVRVLPYYLHLLDRVRGAAHFEVGEEQARELMEGLRARLPGYLVPRLVREVPGERSKTPVA
jgi:EF-P beta-lysylation protein EpmB